MKNILAKTFTVFAGPAKIARGSLTDIAKKIKTKYPDSQRNDFLIFNDSTGQQIDINLRGSLATVLKRLEGEHLTETANEQISDVTSSPDEARSGPGRPKLGVVAREVTLLPRHWEWLSQQPGGASVTLRKLVEDAKKKNSHKDSARRSQEAAHKFMTAMAGDLIGFEEALRALYAGQGEKFKDLIKPWPKDIRLYTIELAKLALESFS